MRIESWIIGGILICCFSQLFLRCLGLMVFLPIWVRASVHFLCCLIIPKWIQRFDCDFVARKGEVWWMPWSKCIWQSSCFEYHPLPTSKLDELGIVARSIQRLPHYMNITFAKQFRQNPPTVMRSIFCTWLLRSLRCWQSSLKAPASIRSIIWGGGDASSEPCIVTGGSSNVSWWGCRWFVICDLELGWWVNMMGYGYGCWMWEVGKRETAKQSKTKE